MKLEDVLPHLRDGKKVGRTPTYFLEIKDSEVFLVSGGVYHSFDDYAGTIDSDDFLAEDWEVIL